MKILSPRACTEETALRNISVAIGFAIALATTTVQAADTKISEEYDKLIKHRGEITAFGDSGFGDRIDIGSGGLEIVQIDVDLPGNNALIVRIGRRFTPGNKYAGGNFGVWNLDIPYLHGVFGDHQYNPKGWTVAANSADVYKRCSLYGPPLTLVFQTGVFEPDEYWQGNFLHLPDVGDEELLSGGPGTHVPSDGLTYPVVTKSGAAARCISLAATSEAGSQGEAFEVVTADGTVYTLNQMVSRTADLITKPIDQMGVSKVTAQKDLVTTIAATNFVLPRKEVFLYPTKVSDRFGNTVTYTWSATNPWQLLQITASDGRQITLTYESSTSKQVSSVSDGGRTWTYAGTSSAYTVTQPDGSKWISNLTDLFNFKLSTTGDGCSGEPAYVGTPPSVTGTISAPTGATAIFVLKPVKMGRSWVPAECVSDSSGPIYAREPIAYYNFAVIGKTITGPGLPISGVSWSHAYGPTNGCWSSGIGTPLCTGASPKTRTVSVTGPGGDVTRYTFGNQFFANEGRLLKIESGWNGSAALRTVETTYGDPYAAPYANFYGGTPRSRGDALITSFKMPPRMTVTAQQGRTFTWEVATGCGGAPYCFDTFARPTKVIRSSSP